MLQSETAQGISNRQNLTSTMPRNNSDRRRFYSDTSRIYYDTSPNNSGKTRFLQVLSGGSTLSAGCVKRGCSGGRNLFSFLLMQYIEHDHNGECRENWRGFRYNYCVIVNIHAYLKYHGRTDPLDYWKQKRIIKKFSRNPSPH